MKDNKALCLDALTMEFYKTFSGEVVLYLTRIFSQYLQNKKIPPSWNDASILLLPKWNKDHLKINSYRPISLLNMNYKILFAILARINGIIG